tara:strand:+ start:854 stop:1525 length:672 start_codon:yes stop_codon:yes gene_type:complete
MNWQDQGFLIYKNKYNENSSIAEFFTKDRGKVSGIIYGASSRKIRNYLLIGNNFHINYLSKNESKIGYFKIEIERICTAKFIEDPKKLACICYLFNMIKILTVENQKNFGIYTLVNSFFDILEDENWLTKFIYLELDIFNKLGYMINFKNYISETKNNNNQYYLKNDKNRIIPEFLIDNKAPVSNFELSLGLKIVGDFLEKSILQPNNLNQISSRIDFVNKIK